MTCADLTWLMSPEKLLAGSGPWSAAGARPGDSRASAEAWPLAPRSVQGVRDQLPSIQNHVQGGFIILLTSTGCPVKSAD